MFSSVPRRSCCHFRFISFVSFIHEFLAWFACFVFGLLASFLFVSLSCCPPFHLAHTTPSAIGWVARMCRFGYSISTCGFVSVSHVIVDFCFLVGAVVRCRISQLLVQISCIFLIVSVGIISCITYVLLSILCSLFLPCNSTFPYAIYVSEIVFILPHYHFSFFKISSLFSGSSAVT